MKTVHAIMNNEFKKKQLKTLTFLVVEGICPIQTKTKKNFNFKSSLRPLVQLIFGLGSAQIKIASVMCL